MSNTKTWQNVRLDLKYAYAYIKAMSSLDATQLRKNIYQILDAVLKTGCPVTIKRKGGELEIRPKPKRFDLFALPKQTALSPGVGPEDIIYNDWEKFWNQDSF